VGFVRLSLALFCLGFFCAGLLAGDGGPARADEFNTGAAFALVEDYDSGAVLFEKNPDEPMPPASTAKLLTVEIVFRELKEGRLHLDDNFDVSERAWREGGAHAHGAAMFLAIHSHVRVEDLLRGLIIQSGNDAAMTLAEGIAGTEDNFAEMMNKRATELGMTHSHFANARGKADPNQHVTARDMALLAAHVIRDYPEYYHYFAEKEFTWNKIRQLNRNPLLTMDLGADGLKAGDVADGGFALIGSAVQDNQRLIVVMNGLKSATDRAEEARKLVNYGFHSFDRRTLFDAGATVGAASVYGGEVDSVPLVSDAPIVLFVPRGESDKLIAKIVYTGPLAAPVEQGKAAGLLKIWRGDMLVIDAPLRTGAAVALGGLTRRAFDAGVELAGDAVRRALKRQ
jgi:serine-type D-Ala-D-Ala carboxypeptidase (penicillin-binding protein 5/6)